MSFSSMESLGSERNDSADFEDDADEARGVADAAWA
jgi:hypothetical protein